MRNGVSRLVINSVQLTKQALKKEEERSVQPPKYLINLTFVDAGPFPSELISVLALLYI